MTFFPMVSRLILTRFWVGTGQPGNRYHRFASAADYSVILWVGAIDCS